MEKMTRPCGNCGKEVVARVIPLGPVEPGEIRKWLCPDCFGLGPDDPLRTTAEKIEKAEADGTLDKYRLSERLENLKGQKVQ
jgi:hypothetical protein